MCSKHSSMHESRFHDILMQLHVSKCGMLPMIRQSGLRSHGLLTVLRVSVPDGLPLEKGRGNSHERMLSGPGLLVYTS